MGEIMRIYISQGAIRGNETPQRAGRPETWEPPIIVEHEDGTIERAFTLALNGPSALKYEPSPDPMAPGLIRPPRVWIETPGPIALDVAPPIQEIHT